MTLKDFGSIRGVVFLLMAGGVVLFTAIKIITGEQFVALASMAFVAYFSRGRDTKPNGG